MFAQIYSQAYVQFLAMLLTRSKITTITTAFVKNSSFVECVLQDISNASADTKLSVVTGEDST